MTVSWTMVRSFNAEFALTTGPWNHSWTALCDSREFVLSFPTSDMIDIVVGIGMCSGADTDKFARFGLTAVPASHLRASLIKECLANIECRVEELIERLDLVLLRGIAAHVDAVRTDIRLLHAVGDGTFTADGERFDRREAMRAKLPTGCRRPIAAGRPRHVLHGSISVSCHLIEQLRLVQSHLSCSCSVRLSVLILAPWNDWPGSDARPQRPGWQPQ